MIAIVNVGVGVGGLSTYEVSINADSVCTFQHKRSAGLAECLRKAAAAVELRDVQDIQRIMDLVRGD